MTPVKATSSIVWVEGPALYREFNWIWIQMCGKLKSLTVAHAVYVTYCRCDWLLELTSFNPQTCFTTGGQIVKYCLRFSSRNCRQCVAVLTATVWLTNCRFVSMCTVHCVILVTQSISVCCLYQMCQDCVMYISVIHEYAVQFSTVDLRYGEKSYEHCT